MDVQELNWRQHLATHEAEQLQRSPLCAPSTPLERAQYGIALKFFEEEFSPTEFNSSTLCAFRADDVTRLAFYYLFGQGESRPFCIRTKEWSSVFSGDYLLARNSSMTRHWHEFKPYVEGAFHLDPSTGSDSIIEDYPPETLLIRTKGVYWGPMSAHGWTDYWHWNGDALVHLEEFDWSWMS